MRDGATFPSGRTERVPIDGLARFVAVAGEAKLHDATAAERDAPTLVRVGVASPFLANGFVVADTPGLASINPAHRRATLAYLPGADAVLYLIDTQQPFTDGDAAFLGIIRRYIESMFIVQTKIDLWRMTEPTASAKPGRPPPRASSRKPPCTRPTRRSSRSPRANTPKACSPATPR